MDAAVFRLPRVHKVVTAQITLLHLVIELTNLLLGQSRVVEAHVAEVRTLQIGVALEGGTPQPIVAGSLGGETLAHREHRIIEGHQATIQEEATLIIVLRIDHILPLALRRGFAQIHQGLVLPTAHRVLGTLDVEFVGVIATLGEGIDLLRREGPQEVALPLERGLRIDLIAHRYGELAHPLQPGTHRSTHIDVAILVAQIDPLAVQHGRATQLAIEVRAALIGHHTTAVTTKIVVQHRLLSHQVERATKQQQKQ